MLDYQYQGSSQTLAEGLAEYARANAEHLESRQTTAEAEEFFRCHDIAHIVFGCDISLDEEAVVKISSILGTTAGFSVMQGYRLAESKEIYKKLTWQAIVQTTIRSLTNVPRTIWRCARMHKRWEWSQHQDLLDTPLVTLRQQFGIRVANQAARGPA